MKNDIHSQVFEAFTKLSPHQLRALRKSGFLEDLTEATEKEKLSSVRREAFRRTLGLPEVDSLFRQCNVGEDVMIGPTSGTEKLPRAYNPSVLGCISNFRRMLRSKDPKTRRVKLQVLELRQEINSKELFELEEWNNVCLRQEQVINYLQLIKTDQKEYIFPLRLANPQWKKPILDLIITIQYRGPLTGDIIRVIGINSNYTLSQGSILVVKTPGIMI